MTLTHQTPDAGRRSGLGRLPGKATARPTFTRIRAGDVRILAPRDILALCAVAGFVAAMCAVIAKFGGA